jgi:hypothetical protein
VTAGAQTKPPKVEAFRMEVGTLGRALTAVLPARGRDPTRPGLRAVLISVTAKVARFEATDGHRLHRALIGLRSDALSRPGVYRLSGLRARELLQRLELRNHNQRVTVRLRPGDLGISPERLASLGTTGGPPAAEVDANAGYMREAFAAAEFFGCTRVHIQPHGADESLLLKGSGMFDDEFFEAIVMPMRRDAQAERNIAARQAFLAAVAAGEQPKESHNV